MKTATILAALTLLASLPVVNAADDDSAEGDCSGVVSTNCTWNGAYTCKLYTMDHRPTGSCWCAEGQPCDVLGRFG